MKLTSHLTESGPRAGVLADDQIIDAGDLLGIPSPIRDVLDLIACGPDVLARLAELLDRPHSAKRRPLQGARLLAPIRQPPSVRDHVAFEEHATRQFTRTIADVWYRRPIHYYSNPSRIVGPESHVPVPATERLDYELELAAIVGTEAADVAEADALRYIFGFTILNDWSARDLLADELAYGLGPAKGKDFATSLGPWVVTTDELLSRFRAGVLDLRCAVTVNSATWADSNACHQVHTWGAMVEHASQDSRLIPGDIIASGTVGGCSVAEGIRKGFPARYLVPGDRVELSVEGIGTLANTIVANPHTRPARYTAKDLPPMPVPLPSPGPAGHARSTTGGETWTSR